MAVLGVLVILGIVILVKTLLNTDVSEILCVRSGYSQSQFNDAVNRSPKTMAN